MTIDEVRQLLLRNIGTDTTAEERQARLVLLSALDEVEASREFDAGPITALVRTRKINARAALDAAIRGAT